jgi:hypothetical protein
MQFVLDDEISHKVQPTLVPLPIESADAVPEAIEQVAIEFAPVPAVVMQVVFIADVLN